MKLRNWAFAFTFCLAVCSLASGQSANPDAGKKLADLVAKLGSTSFAQREQARKEIELFGPAALEPLRRAKRTADAEANRRIDGLIRLFEEQVLTEQILTPKFVHLKLKDATVQKAIAELASLSGYPIQFQGDATVFADKKINLDTGKTSFWQALDHLCEHAGLMERIDLTPPANLAPNTNKIRPAVYAPQTPTAVGPIVLVNRGDHKSLVSYAGAVKTELRIRRVAKEWDLLFIVSAEPRLQNSSVAGRPLMQKMLDSQSKKLVESQTVKKSDAKDAALWEANEGQPQRRITGIRLKEEPGARQFKELAGRLTLQVDVQNEMLARIDNVMQASGKSASGASGGTLKVLAAKKLGNGDIEVQVALENLIQNPFGGNVIINGGNVVIRGNVNIRGMVIGPNGVQINGGGSNQRDLPDLLDAKGEKYKVAGVRGDSFNFINGYSSRNATIVYQAKHQAEPRELVLFGTRTYTIGVPFRFENLPLP